ncbi:MAG: hypothetical protein SFY69_05480 [Planctomycetota bacterium]|nr:hypothetical protein [Planctomycetota bacterium]
MGPSEKTFNQVKSILGKLDRSIDQLRAQRTSPAPPAQAIAPEPARPVAPAPNPPAAHRPTSIFGRATPIRSN